VSYVKDWDSKALIASVSGRLINGMDKACSFAAEQARAKAPKKTGLLKSEIDYEVRPEGNSIVGYIGVKKDKAFYGLWRELGTSKMPAHPFLRPAVFENADQIVKLLTEG